MATYQERLDAFRRSDAERELLVQEVLQNYDQLRLQYERTRDDYNNEVASRRMWQSQAANSEQSLAQLRQASNSNSFVLALIDGDGALFQDALYAAGKEGGAQAAQQLHSDIKSHLQTVYPDSNVADWSIVAQIILNQHGLATKLASCGIISNPNELGAFGRAFGLAQPLFSFVDVGSGKERADHKIRESLRLYLPNAQCRHVFFGPCHDNGYLPVLEPYRLDSSTSQRLTLVETRPAEPGFKHLSLPRVTFPHTFRADDLPNRTSAQLFPPQPVTLPVRTVSGNVHSSNGNHLPPAPKPSSPSPSAESSTSANNHTSWATLGKNGSVVGKSINIAPKKAQVKPHVLVNVHDERVDPELPRADYSAESRFFERMKHNGKCCNNFHLTGKCEAGEYCDYDHTQKLTPGELLVLKHKARGRSCPNASLCRDPDCTYGHHCKSGKKCIFDTCWFVDTHHMDLTPAKRVYPDGAAEWLQSYLDKVKT